LVVTKYPFKNGANYKEKNMIRNRNIAQDAAIDQSKIIGSAVGEVRYVCKSGSNAHAMLLLRVPGELLYVCDGTADEVQINQAISDGKGGTNSYVYVFPGAYTLAGAITMASRSSTHLVGVNGLGVDVGCVGAAALTQGGAYQAVIMEAYGELTGFQIINKAGYSAVTMADGKWRANVHNNYFHMTQGSAADIIQAVGSGMSHGYICNNRFETWVAGAITSAISVAGAVSATISNNIIVNYSGTMDVGINLGNSVQCVAMGNIVSDCGGAGTITDGIAAGTPTGNVLVNNSLGLPTGSGVSGGTANRTFVNNRDAQAGGATPIES
jgi:hypothetical protein